MGHPHLRSAFSVEPRTDTPVAYAALHDGHEVRPEVAEFLALTADERRREEDPLTASWIGPTGTRMIARHSRFEVDLNRPREQAVYDTPDDAWGLRVWRRPLPPGVRARSLEIYDAFYHAAGACLTALQGRFPRFVVLDLHSYNHRRDGPNSPPANPRLNPEVNLGTGALPRAYWAPVITRFMDDLRQADVCGRRLDVRENVRFRGGYFATWVQEHFPGAGCVLAIEVKKFFMDEWTGCPDQEELEAVGAALATTLPGLVTALQEVR